MYRFLPPLLLLLGIHTVFAKDLLIDYWSVTLEREPLPQQSVDVGDTVTFKVLGRTHVLYLLLRGMHSTHISPCFFPPILLSPLAYFCLDDFQRNNCYRIGAHDVYIHPSLSCDKTDRSEVPISDNNLVTYTFQESDSSFFGKTMLFTCDAGTHCEMGQSIQFRVYPAPQTSAPTTLAPTAAPIEQPDPVNKAVGSLASGQFPSLLSALVITAGTWYCCI
jgi:hypothetical protein